MTFFNYVINKQYICTKNDLILFVFLHTNPWRIDVNYFRLLWIAEKNFDPLWKVVKKSKEISFMAHPIIDTRKFHHNQNGKTRPSRKILYLHILLVYSNLKLKVSLD